MRRAALHVAEQSPDDAAVQRLAARRLVCEGRDAPQRLGRVVERDRLRVCRRSGISSPREDGLDLLPGLAEERPGCALLDLGVRVARGRKTDTAPDPYSASTTGSAILPSRSFHSLRESMRSCRSLAALRTSAGFRPAAVSCVSMITSVCMA